MKPAFSQAAEADEDDEMATAQPLPSGLKNYMTPAGYRRLKEEYMHLLDV